MCKRTVSVPGSCQNGRETAVTSGHPRAARTASGLGMGWLTRCVKHTSKQRVMQLDWATHGPHAAETSE